MLTTMLFLPEVKGHCMMVVQFISGRVRPVSYTHLFGNCKLKAIQGINQYFQYGFNFFGYYITARRAGEFNFFLPLQVESYEQGLAFLAYYLRNAHLKNKPDWLNHGLALREHLPWVKAVSYTHL